MKISNIKFKGGYFDFEYNGKSYYFDIAFEDEVKLELNGGNHFVSDKDENNNGYSDISRYSIPDFEGAYESLLLNHIDEWQEEETGERIKLIGTPKKVSEVIHGDLGNLGDHYEQEKPIVIEYKTWGEFNKNIEKDIKKEFKEIL